MKISAQWLKELSKLNLANTKIAEQLTAAGIEVGGIAPAAPDFSGVVVGKVLKVEKHPNAEKLHVCLVDVGEGSPLNIVCGAANVRENLAVPVALIGAKLPGVSIKKAKLRGVESSGMICSAVELGLAETSEGIMELPVTAKIGMDFRQYFQLDDEILDIEITANRGDCLSISGMARELIALNQLRPFKFNWAKIKNKSHAVLLEVLAEEVCPHYLGCVIKNVSLAAAVPIYIKERLRRSGLRSVNAVVDIANYVMLELGQPLHIFDLAKIDTGIKVRYAQAGEKLRLLDGKEVELNDQTLVIADKNKSLAIAGIMGGEESGVNNATSDIFIESAFFMPEKIRKIAQFYGLHTDAAYRFERGVDFELPPLALNRVLGLLLEVVGGVAGKIVEFKNTKYFPKRQPIILRKERMQKKLGISIQDRKAHEILQNLGMQVKSHSLGWKVIPPGFRFDIELEEDLIEEIARIFGYHNIPECRLCGELQPQDLTLLKQRNLMNFMVARGYREIISYSFIDPKLQSLFAEEALVLTNPISSELSVMRSNIWAGLLNVLLHNCNRKHFHNKLFEVGLCFLGAQQTQQVPFIGGLVSSSFYQEQWGLKQKDVDFFDIKGDVESLLRHYGQKNIVFRENSHKFLHPKRSAKIYADDKYVGDIGELHPEIKIELKIPFSVCLFAINLSLLYNDLSVFFSAFHKFPVVVRDIAIIVDESVTWDALKKEIVKKVGILLKNIEIFDIYHDDVARGKKSVAIHLFFQHCSKTLTEVEIEDIMSKIISALAETFGANLRG